MDGEAAKVLAGIEADFPNWRLWQGVNGLWYARRPRSSPPKVVRARNLLVLRARIALMESQR